MTINTKKLTILFTICLIFSIAFSFNLSRHPSVLIRSDHFSRWYAVNKLVTEHRSIYDPQNGKEIVAYNSIPVNPIEGSFFYPAHLLIFFLPIAQLPYAIAHFIWVTAIQLFLLGGLFFLYKEIYWPHTVNQFSLLVLLSILFIPNLQNTIWGQYNTIGVLSLVLIYLSLRREKYFLAGLLSIGLTFKPQNYFLPLLFLLLWALFQRKRYKFIGGFLLSCLVFWGIAEAFEPNWVVSFIRGVQSYNNYLNPHGVLGAQSLFYWLFSMGLILALGWLFIRNRQCGPTSSAFIGCLVLSFGIWWVMVPVLGMMYLVALPILIMLLFSSLENRYQKLSKIGLIGFLCLYGLGLVVFIFGITKPGLYGTHIQWAELAYKIVMPFLIIALAIPLCSIKDNSLDERENNVSLSNQ